MIYLKTLHSVGIQEAAPIFYSPESSHKNLLNKNFQTKENQKWDKLVLPLSAWINLRSGKILVGTAAWQTARTRSQAGKLQRECVVIISLSNKCQAARADWKKIIITGTVDSDSRLTKLDPVFILWIILPHWMSHEGQCTEWGHIRQENHRLFSYFYSILF